MFTTIDKAWVAFFSPVLVFMAEAVLTEGSVPVEVIADPNMWIKGLATGALVWAVPNKVATYQ